MKRIALLLALCLAATSAMADIKIEIPAQPVAVGQNIQVYVRGIEADDLPKAIATHWPREGTVFVPAKTWGNEPFIWFAATQPGKYLVSVTIPTMVDGEASLEHAEAILVVGGDPGPDPDPDPNPNPIPPPPVPGERSMVVLMETSTRTAAEAAMLGALRSYWATSGATYLHEITDKDKVDGKTNQSPAWLQPYLQAVTTKPVTLPALVVIVQTPATPAQFSVVAVESLDVSGAEAVALVKKHEVKQ